ncbi:MAG TPA: NAD(P)-binding domain-containing protein [Candidatus Baltobacteraceae bacterium]|jgi:shikimate dehydrogenase
MKLAIIGDPVEHSRSPRLHETFLREAGIDGSYVAIRVPRGNGIDVVRRMRMDGYTGCNVTMPLKEEVLRACDELEEDARTAGAVNTIFFGNAIVGANTDGIGARIALEGILEEPVSLQRIGIIGTGATARAILTQLHERDAYTFIWGRDDTKVDALCERFEAQPWPNGNVPEIVISTLPADVRFPEELVEALQHCDVVMDVNYGNRSALGQQLHREVIRGDAMLEAQARASFEFWVAHAQESMERFAD